MLHLFAAVCGLIAVGAADAHGFDKAVTPEQIAVMFGDWGLNYQGSNGYEAAKKVHNDIKEAIAMSPSFNDFCNSADEDANKREAAAFFANVRKETGGMAVFEEQVTDPNQYCTSSSVSGASSELKEAGLKYPCVEGSKGYHGRGAIQLTWNINYGRFSEFLYGDKNVLLKNPELVVGAGTLGWASTLWFWMTPQDYGGQCPPKQLTDYLETGTESCHHAIQSGEGMGKTINIINGGYECCSQSSYRSSAIARMQSYMDFLGILGAKKGNKDCSDGNFAYCEMSQGCPLISVRKDKGFPIYGTCTSSLKPRWIGSESVQVTVWSCASQDTGVIAPTTAAAATTTTKTTTTAAQTVATTTTTAAAVTVTKTTTSKAAADSTGTTQTGCKSLFAHISDEWCVANGCAAAYPSICSAV